ncbi:hypothetical protein YH67_20375 [Stenotrophomonas maltophilia]|nr:hypothetical protein YH67_20375 [Stenotrophomonas maltophilia]ALA92452.1 hypothetical protein YH68_20375 [Stenotrophomonas maltophilia]
MVQMALAHHDRRLVEDIGVELLLQWKSPQGVDITLDLVAVQMAIDDTDIDPAGAARKPHFLHHKRVRICDMLSNDLAQQS